MPSTRRLRADGGQGLVEYALVLLLVSVAALTTLNSVGDRIAGVFSEVTGVLSPQGGGNGNGWGQGGNGNGNNGNGNGNGGPVGDGPAGGGGGGGKPPK